MGLFTSRPMPTRRSKRIVWQKYERLTIDTDVTTDAEDDDEDAEDDAKDAEDVDAEDTAPRKRKRVDAEDETTTRVMTRKDVRASRCKCPRTPFHPVTGLALVCCCCGKPSESTEAEFLGQEGDLVEFFRQVD